MATLKQIRSRIRTAKTIQQITRAMKLVAAARLKKAQDRVIQARPYADSMTELMSHLGGAGELPEHPLLVKRPEEHAGVLIITSDRGLCGSFNSNLLRYAEAFMASHPKDFWRLVTIGKKAHQYFTKRGYQVVDQFSFGTSGATLADATAVTERVRLMFESGETDSIYLLYSKFISALKQVPSQSQLLPIEPPHQAESGGLLSEFTFEPSPAELLSRLLPRYLLTLVFQSILEATASEHGSRMTAMTLATDNAGKMIRDLTLHANTVRQAAITKELLEVVGGAEALSG
jgi:F-type H+-transporting ATPase subunit gamma